jgi:hypothetical protein
MKHLSMQLLLFISLFLLPRAAHEAPARQALYYWYTWPTDTYNDWATVSNETYEMWLFFDGTVINQNPIGGTLIDRGFFNNSYPHNELPYIYLYAHFTY